MSSYYLEELKGKRVHRITVDANGGYVRFDIDGDSLTYAATGDCCSRSWIEQISDAQNLIGEVVLDIEDIELPNPDPQPAKYECLAVYGHAIKTAKGICQIEHRNDSNGYYGGSLEPSSYYGELPIVVEHDWTCNDAERKDSYE